MKLLLTGASRSGKSTLVRRLIGAYPGLVGGYLTAEMRGEDGKRCGLELEAIWRAPGSPVAVVERKVLAHLQQDAAAAAVQVGRYSVRPSGVDLAVQAMDGAMHEGALVVVDEVGPLQSPFSAFRDAMLRCLDSRLPMLATLAQATDPFLDALRARPGVRVVEVTRANRSHLADGLLTWLCAVDDHRW